MHAGEKKHELMNMSNDNKFGSAEKNCCAEAYVKW